MRAFAARSDAISAELIGRVLCHDRGALRKGHTLREEDLAQLAGEGEIHLLELGPADIGQKEAGRRLADAIGEVRIVASGHRHVLRAPHAGLLDVDIAALQRINAVPGVAVFTTRSGEVVTADQVIAHAQITSLAIDRRALEVAERIAREEQPVVRVRPFMPRDAILWKRDDRLVAPLGELLDRLGCRLGDVLDLPRDPAAIRASLESRLDSAATLFLVAGSNALDPLDPIFVALDAIGATMRKMGMPVHPGTLLWIATLRETTIVGLPSCGLRGAFELVLPRLLVDGDVDFAALGHGGGGR